MYVKYRISDYHHEKEKEEFFNMISNIFKKEAESKTSVHLSVDGSTIVYQTCCGNEWFVEKDKCEVYFGYSGTREGFSRLQPFNELMWFKKDDIHPVLSIVELKEKEVYKGYTVFIPVPKYLYKLDLVEYHTTLKPKAHYYPTPFAVVRRLGTGEAVVIDIDYVWKIEYKNVYAEDTPKFYILKRVREKDYYTWRWFEE